LPTGSVQVDEELLEDGESRLSSIITEHHFWYTRSECGYNYVPIVLKYQIEEMLTARACPIMTVYRKHGGQRGYQGHVLNLPQNIQQFLKKLPAPIASLPILIIKRVGAENTTAEFRVRQQKVLSALLWLKCNNRFYHDIDIDQVTIASLPQDGIPTELQQIDTDRDEDSVSALPQGPPLDTYTDNGEAEICQTNSFLLMPQGVQREEDSIRQSIAGSNILDWLA